MGRVVLITGAGQGIGRVIATKFAALGTKVVVADINPDTSECVAAEIRASNGEAHAQQIDVASPESVQRAVAQTVDRYGTIDVLINNAAIFSTLQPKPLTTITLSEWEQVLRVNVTGAFLCLAAVAPVMEQVGWGRIIMMSSSTVAMGTPLLAHYVASKAALIGLTRSAARELGSSNITVNAVLPGSTETEIERATTTPEVRRDIVQSQAIKRQTTAEDLFGLLAFLASDASEMITGQSFIVDGGRVLQ